MIRIFMVGYSEKKGGVETYISNLCKYLDKKEFDIVYCWPQMELNGKIWHCPRNRHNYFKYYRFWKQFFSENHFDALYYNACDIVSIDMLRFAREAGIKVRILHSHNTGIQQKMRIYHWVMEKWNRLVLPKYATHLLACSEYAGRWMFDNKPFKVINNSVELSKFMYSEKIREKKKRELHIQNELVIGCVGRLEPQKNISFAIDVLAELVKINDEIKLVIVGEGYLKGELEKKVHEKNLDDYVIFLGVRNDVNELMSMFDCLLMPSYFEGLPFVLVEAQVSGLSCVVSNNVSPEANLTGCVEFVSLNDDVRVWAEKIIENAMIVRKDYVNVLVEKGYSIEKSAREIADILRIAKL